MASREAAIAYPPPSFRRALKLVERNAVVYKHLLVAFITGFFEPVFYLGAIGFGVGQFVGTVQYAGHEISYAVFLAPGMLAASVMNAAIFDGFFGPFFKLNWMKVYEGIVTTPINVADIAVGEIVWASFRALIYSVGFMTVMLVLGLIESVWAVLLLPAVLLSGAALSAGAMILTGITKEISSLEKVMTLVYFPLFLFSATFFPLSLYPEFLQPVVQVTPLYHAAALMRGLTIGEIDISILWHVGYLVAMFLVCSTVATRLIRKKLVW